ncbi:fungal-specific transcription factor domain-containing protein [Flagelloscypha sp. PMI_526]|nr:fungal-specific transcription factor domain-containing protein [Flagelloscypha sp. PMI_526]
MDKTRRVEHQNKLINSRMSRGLVACAECRRMKLKCDKKYHIVRRECSSICPTGKLTSRRESRTILVQDSSSPNSQNRILQLRERGLQLENALAIAHSHLSKDIHPLLADAPLAGQPQDDVEVDKITDILGTLAVGEAGEVKYFGPSASTETLYQAISVKDEAQPSRSPSSQANPVTIFESLSAQMLLSSPFKVDSFVSFILTHLPEKKRAFSLCGTFYQHFPLYCMPIPREELVHAYISPMYKYLEDSRTGPGLPSTVFRPHQYAVVFFALALSAWLDLTVEKYWLEADRYFQIGLSCLSMQSIFNSPEVASVQALFLLGYYNEHPGAASTATLSPSWTILSVALKLAQGLGLHRDPAKWNLDTTTVQRRRWLFWEMESIEIFHSLGTGRPLSNRPSYIDAELPDDVGRTDAHGQPLQGFFRFKHELIRDCYLDVVETLLAATPVKYEVILELDRKVRAKAIPAHLNRILIDPEDGPNLTAPEFMQMCILGVSRSMVLLSIHRAYLPRTLQDPSGNPLKSRYAPSFLASYRAASWIVKSFHAGQRRFSALFSRLWHPWTYVLTAAMVLGSIAIHAPSSLIGKGPLEELRVASSMLRDAAARTVSFRTKNGAKVVQKLLTRAEEAHAQHSGGDVTAVQSGIFIPPANYGDDELAIFGGQTRILPMRPHQMSPSVTTTPLLLLRF